MNIIKQIFKLYPELWLMLLILIISISGFPMIGFWIFIGTALIFITRLIILLIINIKNKKEIK